MELQDYIDKIVESDKAQGVDLAAEFGPFPTDYERFYEDQDHFEAWVYDCFGQITGAPLEALRVELAHVRDCKAKNKLRGWSHAELENAYKDLGSYVFSLLDSVVRSESDVAEGVK